MSSSPPSRLVRWLGLEPSDAAPLRQLGGVLAITSFGEILVEGAVTSAFLARVGASALPTALAVRALAEVLLSLGYDRAVTSWRPRRALLGVGALGAVVLALCAAFFGQRWGVWVAYVAAAVLTRLKTIHFGVLALADLPEDGARRALPALHACGRLGAIAAGPVVAWGGSALGGPSVLGASALAYLGATLLLTRRGRTEQSASSSTSGRSAATVSPILPPAIRRTTRALLTAILIGAVALACGRLALTTQAGAILERQFTEPELHRVLGIYFIAANAAALALQLGLVGRLLGSGGVALLNSGWALCYLAAQLALSLGPAVVTVALASRAIESELRNAVRTPVANLLYDAMPADRRAFARTLVIGVAVPAASLVAGLGLTAIGSRTGLLSGLGVSAAVLLLAATVGQNLSYRAARRASAAAGSPS